MKKVLILFVAFMATNLLTAQNIIDKHFDHFAEDEKVTSVHVSGKMFQYAGFIQVDAGDKEAQEIKDMITSINSFSLIAVPELESPKDEYFDALDKVGDEFEELLRIRDKNCNFTLFVNETDEVVREVVGIAAAEDKFIVFTLEGLMDLNHIGKLIAKVNADGFEKIADATDTGLEQVKVYPNPVGANSDINLEIPDNLIGGTAKIYDMEGNLIDTRTVQANKSTLSTTSLRAGYYLIEVQKEGLMVKKKIAVVQ